MTVPRVHGITSSIVFYILLGILVVPSVFYIYQSYSQLGVVMTNINTPLKLSTPSFLAKLDESEINLAPELVAKVSLENDVMRYRHQRSTAFLATRTWMRFMSLIFGAIAVMIGSAFVLGKINGPPLSGEVSFRDIGANIATGSPGLLLVLLGVLLIAIPNLSNQRIETYDAALYVGQGQHVSVIGNDVSTKIDKQKRNKELSEIKEKLNEIK